MPGPGVAPRPRRGSSQAAIGAMSASSVAGVSSVAGASRSEEHTSELQSHVNLVCRLLLEKKKKLKINNLRQQKKKNKAIDPTRTRTLQTAPQVQCPHTHKSRTSPEDPRTYA